VVLTLGHRDDGIKGVTDNGDKYNGRTYDIYGLELMVGVVLRSN